MDSNPRGFKFRTIIDNFAWDILRILREILVEKSFDTDHLKLRMLMTLSDVSDKRNKKGAEFKDRLPTKSHSHSYVKKLLFRDFSATKDTLWHTFHLPATEGDPACTINIHDEAITYLSSVLERRLTLAQNLKDKPTNTHALLEIWSQHSALHADWKSAHAHRQSNVQSENEDRSYFHDTAQKLAEQRSSLGLEYSEISHRRREQYGPIWLIVSDCRAEVPEELSLFNVLGALPLPLGSGFANEKTVQKSLVRVLDSLNERYKLLRSAGLPPYIWLDRTHPPIAVLRESKRLRTDADGYIKTGEAVDILSAYRKAFEARLKNENRKKLVGCTNFDEFAQTEFGMTMLKYFALSLEQSAAAGSDEELSLYDAIPGSDIDEDLSQSVFAKFDNDFDWVQYLIDTRPELFDDVMIVFFRK